ncbi:MAG TPA: DUF4190 domain-containing protein [Pirellulaceae bacterium]|jgi:hypothetical protein|nr:DUF4190 domain-containing protein [Pirellulaceae bacterium]
MSDAAKPVPPKDEGNNPLALVSLILAIIGLVTAGCPFSLAAVITGWMGMKREPSGQAKIGFWLGVAGIILQLLIGLLILVLFGAAIGLTAVEVDSAPPMPAPAEVEVIELSPMVSESADEALEAEPVEPMVEEAESELETDPIQPPVEEVPETAP